MCFFANDTSLNGAGMHCFRNSNEPYEILNIRLNANKFGLNIGKTVQLKRGLSAAIQINHLLSFMKLLKLLLFASIKGLD